MAASGQGGVEAVYADENVWLSQKMMGVLYAVETHTINYHLKKVFNDAELEAGSVIRNFRITAADGKTYDALRQIPMTMQDWEIRLNRFIAATDREILQDAGKVTAEIAQAHAESEFEKYRIVQDRLFESDFDRMLKQLPETGAETHAEARKTRRKKL